VIEAPLLVQGEALFAVICLQEGTSPLAAERVSITAKEQAQMGWSDLSPTGIFDPNDQERAEIVTSLCSSNRRERADAAWMLRHLSPSEKLSVFYDTGHRALDKEDFALARSYFQQYADLERQFYQSSPSADTLYLLGYVCQKQNDLTAARAFHTEALRLYRQSELYDKAFEAKMLHHLGDTEIEAKNPNEAFDYLLESCRLYRTLDNPQILAHLLYDLGYLCSQTGDTATAQNYWQEGIDVARNAQDAWNAPPLLYRLAIAVQEEAPDKAQSYLEEALEWLNQRARPYWLHWCATLLARIAEKKQDWETGYDYLQMAYAAAVEIGDTRRQADTLYSLGACSSKRQSQEEVCQRFAQCAVLYKQCSDPVEAARSFYAQGNFERILTNYQTAETVYQEGLLLLSPFFHNGDTQVAKLIAKLFEGFAILAVAQENYSKAALLFGVAEALPHRQEYPYFDELRNYTQGILGVRRFTRDYEIGRALSFTDAQAYVLKGTQPPSLARQSRFSFFGWKRRSPESSTGEIK
jgi:outer membrane protein assembly factor BamD (BamD/ComL family)